MLQNSKMAHSLMTLLDVMLKLAYHLSIRFCICIFISIATLNGAATRATILRELVVGLSTQAPMRTVCVSIASTGPR